MIKTLCLGGSFNPIHHGHLICARAAAEAGGFDRVLLIPSSQPPHKPGHPELAAASDRLAMTRLAVAGDSITADASSADSFFEVDPLEIDRTGASFTIDTARELKRRGMQQVHWLIGADLLPQFHRWREPAALLSEIMFWVIQRPRSPIDWPSLSPEIRQLRDRLIVAPEIDISATDIRNRLKTGKSIDFLTPPPVIAYIRDHHLYSALRP